jgi:tetratricopeptide (TPR) repeat protein
VFVDTRHHLTEAMWPVFLRSHRPLERPAAMEEAFRRWGVELAVFAGPTFPLVLAPPEWQLLYKAGEQEVFQRRGGAHADANLRRARAALRRLGADPGRDGDGSALARAATEAGARSWLAHPYQRRRAGRAQRALAAAAPAERARGHRIRGDLLLRAGSYARAAADFEQAAALVPDDARSRYHAALAHFARGDAERARASIASLGEVGTAQLPPVDRARAAMLQLAVAARTRLAPP